jgi:16S rRNA (cytidine1402-2'-O)-methyltransferase
MKLGRLWIVATPIGDPGDITLRAIEILKQANAVICEEQRIGSTLLKRLSIQNEIILLNEHNEEQMAPDIVSRLLTGQHLALISDCGTPVFADPGHTLIRLAVESGIPIFPIPGASSLMATLSILDFKLDKFVFGGFLPRDGIERKRELQRLRSLRMAVVLMDTPYRLASLLEDVGAVFGRNQIITLALDLTLPGEVIYRDTVFAVSQQVGKRKAEFMLVINPPGSV